MLPDLLFNDVNFDALKLLEEYEIPESRRLEYKLKVPLNNKADKREFCADVSALANADGGYLLIGIQDAKESPEGKPVVVGIPKPEKVDGYISDLEKIIKSGVEPNIHGINIKAIGLGGNEDSRIVLAIFVPASWLKPHWIGTEKSRSFCSRNSNGKYYLDINEVRQMFLLSDTAAERIRGFRKSSVEAIHAGATPVTVSVGKPLLILHVLPFSAGSTKQHYDISRIATGKTFNFDGVYAGMDFRVYEQIFRDGSLEFVWNIPVRENQWIPGSDIEEYVWMNCLTHVRDWYKEMEVFPPTFYMLSLIDVLDHKLLMTSHDLKRYIDANSTAPRESTQIDRDQLLVAETIVYEADLNPDQQMKHLRAAFDAMWQASGLEGSVNYDKENGDWLRPERDW